MASSYHEYKDNLPEGSNFASASARARRYFKIVIFAPKFAPQVSTHVSAKFLSASWEFYKNGDKFGWFAKFAKVFPRHNFMLYGMRTYMHTYIRLCINMYMCMCMYVCIHVHNPQLPQKWHETQAYKQTLLVT